MNFAETTHVKRITSIKGVGPYANCSAGSVEFRKTAVVFGYNSYGKSTLCELLRSLETGNTDEISIRGTIPGPIVQQVTLTFAEDGKGEEPLLLKEAKWNPTAPTRFKIQVFDSAFVSRNLFAGNRAERNNKEALSRFVLGEQGVQQANEIADSRRRLAGARSSRKKLKAQLQGVGDVDEFVKLPVTKSEDALNSELRPLVIALEATERNLAAVYEIQGRSLLSGLEAPTGEPFMFERLNEALQYTLKSTHDVARTRLEQHVQEHLGAHTAGASWLRQGMAFSSSTQCPYCEQALDGAPQGLLDAYREFFDDAFDRQSTALIDDLDAFDRAAQRLGVTAQESGLAKDMLVLAKYRELDKDEAFKISQARLIQLGEAVKDAAIEYMRFLEPFRQTVAAVIQQKRSALQAAVPPLELREYRQTHAAFEAAAKEFTEQAKSLNEMLAAFKVQSTEGLLAGEVTRLNAEILSTQRSIRRVTSAPTCDEYKAANDLEAELEEAIKKLESDLTTQQSEYLKKFFERINYYFTKFGSNHFTIGVDERLDMQGYQPVLSLVVKYHGVAIDPQNLGAVFSESDRRALALSIFWAKLSVLSDADRAMTIAVLDDPVTSFDDNRIAAAVMQMRMEATSIRQLLVFSHYHAFVRHWLDVEHVSGTMSFHKLTRSDVTSGLVDGDPNEFLHSEQQKLFRKFVDFIEGRTQQPIGVDLRVYLESEIRDRYRQQIIAGVAPAAQLSEVIDYLEATGAIQKDAAKKAHFFREDLNGPHHVLSARGREDWASLARLMLDFIYTEL